MVNEGVRSGYGKPGLRIVLASAAIFGHHSYESGLSDSSGLIALRWSEGMQRVQCGGQ